jgi:polyphosphate kinase
VPVEDPSLQGDLFDVLDRSFADNSNAWDLDADGRWTRRSPDGGERRNLQEELCERHAGRVAEPGVRESR